MIISDLSSHYQSELITNNLWDPQISVDLSRLKSIKLKYYDFSGIERNDGLMIVHDLVAADVIKVFQYLWEQKFPIAKIKPTSDYLGDDVASMEDNNSSCFNSRRVAGTQKISLHAYGMALDINPRQNPYIRQGIIEPSMGKNYLNRDLEFPGKIEKIVEFVKKNTIFKVWGGDWKDLKDYHHFEVDRILAGRLINLNYEKGCKLIEEYFTI